MEKEGLVSIITPCHNSSKFIYRLMDSVLEQTYRQIEMVTVDNDSQDETAEIIKGYIPRFEKKGYTLQYIHQDDLGPSAGIQTGLRFVTGEYLFMPDSDDWYAEPNSIEKIVQKFKDLPDDYAVIRCQQAFINEETMKPMGISYQNTTEDDPGTLFEDCLFGLNEYNYAPINYAVKISALRKETGLTIYNAYNTGQQRQICLPLYYNYKTWTILEPLVCYLVRKNSVSHGDYSKFPSQLQLYHNSPNYIDSILDCINTMPNEKKAVYRNKFLKKCAEKMCFMAVRCHKREYLSEFVADYARFGGNSFVMRIHLIKYRIKLLLNK